MNAKRSVKGWWVICLMAGFCAQPLFAAEAGAVSRAVEVAPPKGWTPDTPLFHDEPAVPGRGGAAVASREEGGHVPNPTRAAHRLEAASGDEVASLRRTRGQKGAERPVATKRQPLAKAASPSRAADRRARAATGKGASLKEARVAQAKGAKATATARKASARRVATQQPAATARTAAAKHGAERKGALAINRSASSRRHASVATQRGAKRASSGAHAGGRASSAAVKKG